MALTYFDSAYKLSLREEVPLSIALFNRACAQARAGRTVEALHSIALLLEEPRTRARYQAKVRADGDLRSLRADPRLAEILAQPGCCTAALREEAARVAKAEQDARAEEEQRSWERDSRP